MGIGLQTALGNPIDQTGLKYPQGVRQPKREALPLTLVNPITNLSAAGTEFQVHQASQRQNVKYENMSRLASHKMVGQEPRPTPKEPSA